MAELPERVLQFGSGKFLRGFADLFIHQANEAGQNIGRVVVVQTTGDSRAHLLARQGGRYHVLVRGLSGGQVVDRVEESASVSRALTAAAQWAEVLAVARSPELRLVLSNTAETGYALDPSDGPGLRPPRSFPTKLLLVLAERFRAGLPGVTVVPCELFEHNADMLRGIVLKLAGEWKLPAGLPAWIEGECRWRNTLVDRIVTMPPSADPRVGDDALAVVGEPYALWAIEVKEGGDGGLPHHPAVTVTRDVQPYFLRKVRILNAAHTALASKAVPRGFATVRQAVADAEVSAWLRRLLFEEIVPTVKDRVEDAEGFAMQTLERFANPFQEHKMSDILVYHAEKVKIRLLPTRDEFSAKFGRTPPLLTEAIAWQAGS
jgi:tagaturonate reductase